MSIPPIGPADQAEAALLAQRRIMVSGPLDTVTVSQLSAQLMSLDGDSDEPVELIVNSSGGPVADVLPLLDILDLMRAPVDTVCIGAAESTAAALVAAGTRDRRAGARARFRLRIDEHHDAEGSATELQRRAAEVAATLEHYQRSLATATGQSMAAIETEMTSGTVRSAAEAVEFGLVDALVGR
ncbi:MAG: ATP-dependent Clp protease proteolytic subunit [Actinomycetota bacterium]